jgi:hypothetical protein
MDGSSAAMEMLCDREPGEGSGGIDMVKEGMVLSGPLEPLDGKIVVVGPRRVVESEDST